MKHIVRLFVGIGVAVILFTIKVMHRGRPDYFTSPSTERYAQGAIRHRGWLNTWDRD